MLICVAPVAWNEHVFDKMTPAQHLNKARHGPRTTLPEVQTALRHFRAIPTSAKEAAAVTQLSDELTTEENLLKAAAEAAANLRTSRAEAIKGLASALKDLGYDYSVAGSDTPDEVVITSEDFRDTDRRVRFLAFMRGRNAPVYGLCANGVMKLRFRSSSVPLLGFNEIYFLNCGP